MKLMIQKSRMIRKFLSKNIKIKFKLWKKELNNFKK